MYLPPQRLRRAGLARHALLTACLLLASVATACSDDENNPTTTQPSGTAMSLSDYSVTLVRSAATPNPTKQITVDVSGASSSAYTWSSGDPAVATISQNGLITARGDGTTFFTATLTADPTINRSVVVNVVSTIVGVSPTSTYSWVGGPTRTLTSTVQNNPNTAVTWSSSNTAVATVSSTGVVTPVAAGTANITATSVGDPSKSAFTAFTVDPAPTTSATLIQSGVAVTGISAAAGTQKTYRIEVPANATSLTAAVTGANGDLDLFVQAASIPAVSYSQTPGSPTRCAAYTATGNETCTITNPQPRVYYILLDAYESFSNTTLTVTVK